ncbi:sensor domain-containing diguanylate cyclase [bacterium]|nr:MAG: sensor domain-containing diguanylate cyclase [bacterium]
MRAAVRWPQAKDVLRLLLFLLFAYLFFPTPLDGLNWLPLHFAVAVVTLLLAIAVVVRQSGFRSLKTSLTFHITLCAVAGLAVKIGMDHVDLIPLIFFVGFPVTLFALDFRYFWVPSATLAGVALGRSLFLSETALLSWTALFFLFSLALGRIMSRNTLRLDNLREIHQRLLDDARDMGWRIRDQDGLEVLSRRKQMETSAALEEDALLQGFMKMGCYLMNAVSGILLIPDEYKGYRIRAATVSKLYSKSVKNDPVSGEKGIIHLAREHDGLLIQSDLRPGSVTIPFYSEEVPVRSIMVRIVTSPPTGEEKAADWDQRIQGVVYFDSTEPDAFEKNDALISRLDIFCQMLSQMMDTGSLLRRVTWDVRSKLAIAGYAEKLTRTLDPMRIAREAVDTIIQGVPKCDGAAFLLNDGGVEVVCSEGASVQGLEGTVIPGNMSSQIGLLIRNRSEIVFNRERAKPSPFFHRKESLGNIVSFAAIPSLTEKEGEDQLMAVLVAVSSSPNVFNADAVKDLRVIADITAQAVDNAMAHREVDRMSRIDGLTGLYNHRTFQLALEERIERIGRDYEKSLAVIMVDVDYFKDVNDTYGHPVGDEVLRGLAGRLKESVRDLDRVARYGGEEFAIILDNVDLKETGKIAEKLRSAVESTGINTTSGPLTLTVSMGYAILSRGDSTSKQELLDRADKALYQAKKQGRNRVVGWEELV